MQNFIVLLEEQMIKLNDNKTKQILLKLINREISFIDASLAYQRSLNKEVLLCMNLITQNSEVIETAHGI